MAQWGRRTFLASVGAAGLGALSSMPAFGAESRSVVEIAMASTIAEALMHEHAVVHRLLGIYNELADWLESGREVPAGALINAGALVDQFVESYHEVYEEDYLYKPFVQAGRHRELVVTLVKQHALGRRLAERTIFLAGKEPPAQESQTELAALCRAYARMYYAHAAWEDTALLPALDDLADSEQYIQMHTALIDLRRERLGETRLDGLLEQVQQIEVSLGIGTLDAFSPAL